MSIERTVAEWRQARREAELHWAKQDCQALDALPEDDIDSQPPRKQLDVIAACEHILAISEPRTAREAYAMLSAAHELLAHADAYPDTTLAVGPVREIVANVTRALERLTPDLAIPREDATVNVRQDTSTPRPGMH